MQLEALEPEGECQGTRRRCLPRPSSIPVPLGGSVARSVDTGLDLDDDQRAVFLQDQVQLSPGSLKSSRKQPIPPRAQAPKGKTLTRRSDLLGIESPPPQKLRRRNTGLQRPEDAREQVSQLP